MALPARALKRCLWLYYKGPENIFGTYMLEPNLLYIISQGRETQSFLSVVPDHGECHISKCKQTLQAGR